VYSPLVNIPGNGANGFEEYISFLYGASISVAALLAVVKIVIAGAKYMMSDVIPAKGEALADIQGAILGLLLILGAVIILEFINPQLIKREIKFEPIAEAPKIIDRNSVVASPEADYASANAAAEAARARLTTNNCGVRTESSEGDYIVQTLDLSACVNDAGKTNALGLFRMECQDHKGAFNISQDRPTCSWAKAGVTKSTYGVTEKQRGKWTLPVEYTVNNAKVTSTNKLSLIDKCTSWYGKPEVLNTGTVSEKVACDQPAVISYSGNQSQFASGDCTDRIPKGTLYDASWAKAGFGIDYYCVIW
jgi:hypothetical protein